MFARVLTLYVRLEKKLELANRIIQDVIPLLQRTVGPLDVFVLQDEKDRRQDGGYVALAQQGGR